VIYKETIEEYRLNEALAAVWELIGFCDRFIEHNRLWENPENHKSEIENLVAMLKEIAKLLQPFLPQTSQKILEHIESQNRTPLFPSLK